MPFTTVTFDGVTLNALNISVQRVPGTVKQVLGTNLVKTPIPGRTVMDYEITIQGQFVGTDRAADRATLQADFASKAFKAYVDGIHDGNYIVEELEFQDSGERPEIYDFSCRLTQWQQ